MNKQINAKQTAWTKRLWATAWVSFVVLKAGLESSPAFAQVVPDTTLGNQSVVNPAAVIRGEQAIQIEGRVTQGNLLFHSFEFFDIAVSDRVYFANPPGIDDILGRVTGRTASTIDGLLGVDGFANLYLINPNGIVFGPNAQLDILGAFTASTADRFTLGSAGEFRATNPNSPPLVVVNIPIGLQFGQNPPAALVNQASLRTDQGLSLSGGEVISTGSLSSSFGQVAVEGVTGDIEVREVNTESAQLSARGEVRIGGQIIAEGGNINIAGAVVNIRNSTINTDVGAVDGGESSLDASGDIIIEAESVTVDNSVVSSRFSSDFQDGTAGNIRVTANNFILSNASTLSSRFSIPADTGSTVDGTAGNIDINANRLILDSGSLLEADIVEIDRQLFSSPTDLVGTSGNITVGAEAVVLRDSSISSSAVSTSDPASDNLSAGNIGIDTAELTVQNNSAIVLSNPNGLAGTIDLNTVTTLLDGSKIISEVGDDSTSSAGNINLTAATLSMRNESLIIASGFNGATSGNISLENVASAFAAPPTGENGSDIMVRQIPADSGNSIQPLPPTILGDAVPAARGIVLIDPDRTLVSGFSFQPAVPGNRTNDIEAEVDSPSLVLPIEILEPGLLPIPDAVDISFTNRFEPVGQQCSTAVPEDAPSSGITLTGRGGLPTTPTDLLEAASPYSDWVQTEQPEDSPNVVGVGSAEEIATGAALPVQMSDRPQCRRVWSSTPS